MSMYNMLFGVCPAADMLLGALGLERDGVPRFRDCFLNEKDQIVVYTRTGGGNREEYGEQNAVLHDVAGFVSDEDDGFDSTYAYFTYALPEKYKEYLPVLRQVAVRDPSRSFKDSIALLNDATKRDSPEYKALMERLKPLAEQLQQAFENPSPNNVTVIET